VRRYRKLEGALSRMKIERSMRPLARFCEMLLDGYFAALKTTGHILAVNKRTREKNA
jgi:hypothetical protein